MGRTRGASSGTCLPCEERRNKQVLSVSVFTSAPPHPSSSKRLVRPLQRGSGDAQSACNLFYSIAATGHGKEAQGECVLACAAVPAQPSPLDRRFTAAHASSRQPDADGGACRQHGQSAEGFCGDAGDRASLGKVAGTHWAPSQHPRMGCRPKQTQTPGPRKCWYKKGWKAVPLQPPNWLNDWKKQHQVLCK